MKEILSEAMTVVGFEGRIPGGSFLVWRRKTITTKGVLRT
jgi:hypothetical protein